MQNSNTNDREVVDGYYVFTKQELDDLIYHAAEDASHQVHYSHLHPNEFPPQSITYWCEEYTKKKLEKLQSQNKALPLTDDELGFREYIVNARNELCSFIRAFEWRTDLRTNIDNILIAYDQLFERHKANRGSGFTLEDIENEKPVLIGFLKVPFGLNGYNKAEAGHEVYELKDRYIIYLTSDRYEPITVPFYKNTLEPFIEKNKA